MALAQVREQYVTVSENVAVDRSRSVVFRWKKGGDDGDLDWQPVTEIAGCPRVVQAWRVDGESDRKAVDESFCTIAWSHLPDDPPQTITYAELNDGTCWARWPGLTVTARREKDFWANVVKGQIGQAHEWGITLQRSQRTTGWHQIGADRRWRYFLRDGRVIGEPLAGAALPIDGYNFPAKHRAAWTESMPELPSDAPTSAELYALAEWALAVDPKGRLLALVGAAARSLIGSLVPAQTIVFAVGESGAGKTSSMNFARGIEGPCPSRMDADVTLSNPTINGVETRLGALHDLPAFADDLHANPTENPHDANRAGQLLDMLITSAADGSEMRARATREARAKTGAILGGLPFVSGEGLPPLLESRMRRMIFLGYAQGEMDLAAFHSGYESRQTVLRRGGHSIIRRMTQSLSSDAIRRVAAIRAWEERQAATIYDELRRLRPEAPDAYVRSLALNYARPLTGLWLLARAAADVALGDDDTLAIMLLGYVIELAAAQLDLMAIGGPGQITREWIVATTTAALGQGRAHLLDMDEARLGATRIAPARLGYAGEFPRGEYLGNLHDERGMVYLIPRTYQELLRQAALRERRAWAWTEQTFPGFLVRLGLVLPEQSGQSAQRVRIAGTRPRRLSIPLAYLFDDEPPDDEPPDPRDAARVPTKQQSQQSQQSHDLRGGLNSGATSPEPGTAPGTAQKTAVPPPVVPGTAQKTAVPPQSHHAAAETPMNSGSATAGTAGTAGTADCRHTRETRALDAAQGYSDDEPDRALPCPQGGKHAWVVAANGRGWACRKCRPALTLRKNGPAMSVNRQNSPKTTP